MCIHRSGRDCLPHIDAVEATGLFISCFTEVHVPSAVGMCEDTLKSPAMIIVGAMTAASR
jgi:hypothetical protein